MKKYEVLTILGLRFSLGFFMFFAGLEKIIDPNWTAKNFLLSAQTFNSFYSWFGQSYNLIWVDPLNSWGITLIGVALILGVFVRYAAVAGAFLMIMYYFPHNVFPKVPHGYIIEEHIIYALVFILIAVTEDVKKFSLNHVYNLIFKHFKKQ